MPQDAVREVHRTTTGSKAASTEAAPAPGLLQRGAAERRLQGGRPSTTSEADGLQLSDEDDDEPTTTSVRETSVASETSEAPEPPETEETDPGDDKKTEKEREIEDLQLEIEAKQNELDQALASGDYDKASRIMNDIQGLQQQLQELISPPGPSGGGAATPVAPAGGPGVPSGGGVAPSGGGGPAFGGAPNYGGGAPAYGGGGAPSYGGGGAPSGGGAPGAGALPGSYVGSEVPLGPPGGGVQKFIDVAKAQQGDPYVFGAEGPNQFDCSGLIYYALRQAGVNVPRETAAGYQERYKDSAVGRDQLKPGDLVFFHSPNTRGIPPGKASHVEIYLGNGMTMGTDNPSEGARIEPINWDTFIGGARVPELYEK